MVDNSLSPHGGILVEKTAFLSAPSEIENLQSLTPIPVRDQLAHECVNIAYGFFSPLDGFMGAKDLHSVAKNMTLDSGYIWSIPIVFDIPQRELDDLDLSVGQTVLLMYQNYPLATMEVTEIFEYDLHSLAIDIYGTNDSAHPGVQRTLNFGDRFLSGPISLINEPQINPPFDEFWLTPRQLRRKMDELGWNTTVAHQSRNVPHSGHEWLMKGAWLASESDGILVSAVIGEKKPGDYIDEAIVLAHDRLRKSGFFKESIHQTSALLWDMRYAGPREAVFHAIVRKNLGCTHHMFGRDHAGVGSYYDTYAAHQIFDDLPDLGIKSVLTLEWWYCPVCAGVAYEGLCGHENQKQELSGTFIRSIIQGGVEPAALTLRPEVLEVVRQCADEYGFGDPFVGAEYLANRTPVMSMHALDCTSPCTCTCTEQYS